MCWDFCLVLITQGWAKGDRHGPRPQGGDFRGEMSKNAVTRGCGSPRKAIVHGFVGDLTCLQSQEKLPWGRWPEFWINGSWLGRRGKQRTALSTAGGRVGWTSGQGGPGGRRGLAPDCLLSESTLPVWGVPTARCACQSGEVSSPYIQATCFFFFFNWGIVVLQCCVSFYCTAMWSRVPCAIQQVFISYLFYTN